MYEQECQLVRDLESILGNDENPFSRLTIAFEFNYQDGKVDIVASNDQGELLSFEAKLSRWRTAVHQAYRNTSFSHYSYVVLPVRAAQRASKRRHEFERRGVGLCAVGARGITIEIPATKKTPLRPWLTNTAMEYINK